MLDVASLFSLLVVAQTASPSPESLYKAAAQGLLSQGVALYQQGEMAPALEKFHEAYATYPSPKLLFNIGQASRDLGRYDESLASFERFLAAVPDASPDVVAEARESIAVLKTRLGTVTIVCMTAGVEIRMDGKKLAFVPPSHLLWAMPGSHQVTARHPEATPAIADVEVAAAEVRTVVLQLQLRASEAKVQTGRSMVASPTLSIAPLVSSSAPTPSGWWLGRRWTWIVAGGAVVLAGSAVATGLVARSRMDRLDRSCGSLSPEHRGCAESDIDSVVTLRNTTNVLWGLAGAAAVTAQILFFVEGKPVSVAPMANSAMGVQAWTVF